MRLEIKEYISFGKREKRLLKAEGYEIVTIRITGVKKGRGGKIIVIVRKKET